MVCAEVNTDVQGFSFGSVIETKVPLLSKLVTIKFLNKKFWNNQEIPLLKQNAYRLKFFEL